MDNKVVPDNRKELQTGANITDSMAPVDATVSVLVALSNIHMVVEGRSACDMTAHRRRLKTTACNHHHLRHNKNDITRRS